MIHPSNIIQSSHFDVYNTHPPSLKSYVYIFESHSLQPQTPDNNYLLYPFPTKSYSIKFDYFTFPSDMSAHGDTTSIPDRFAPIIADGATAFVYQYRGETQQYQLNMQRYEQGIKNMQTLLVNRYDYIRSTYIPRSSYLTGVDNPLRVT